MSSGDCCTISKTIFDKPYFYTDQDVVISDTLLNAIPAYDSSYSGIWRPLFFNGKLYNDSNVGYSYAGLPYDDETWRNDAKKKIGIYNAITVKSDYLIKNWKTNNLTYGLHWMPNGATNIQNVILCWYRYYDINRRYTEIDERIIPGLELYISDGDYWTTNNSGNITTDLNHDANKIYAALTGLNIYSTGLAYEKAKILSTGPQLDWITEVLASGTGIIDPSTRNEYGLDREKLRQMSLKTKDDYGSPNFILNRKDLVNALSNKYNGYFFVDQGSTALLESLFTVKNDDVAIDLPKFFNTNNDKQFNYVELSVEVGSRNISVKKIKDNLDPLSLNVGDLGLPFAPASLRGITFYGICGVGSDLEVKQIETRIAIFGLYHNDNLLQALPIPQNSGFIYDSVINSILLHRDGGVHLNSQFSVTSLNLCDPLSDNRSIQTSFYSPYSAANSSSSTHFDTKYKSGSFNPSNVKILIKPKNSNVLCTIQANNKKNNPYTPINELSVRQLRNNNHINCKPFINSVYNASTIICDCPPLSFGDPSKNVFTNYSYYVPNISSLSGIKSFGGLTGDRLSVFDPSRLKEHLPPGSVFDSTKFGNLRSNFLGGNILNEIYSNECGYSLQGEGDYSVSLLFPKRGTVTASYTMIDGSISMSSPNDSGTININNNENQNSSFCIEQYTTGSEGLVDLAISGNNPWGVKLSFTPAEEIKDIFYPMFYVNAADATPGFFHPNSGWISNDNTEYPRFANKSCTIPHRYGNKTENPRYAALGSYPRALLDYLEPPFLSDDQASFEFEPPNRKSRHDTLNNYDFSAISLLAYNTDKLYNGEFLPGNNLLFNISGTAYLYARDLIDNSKYFGFVIDNKYRYVTKDFNKFSFTKEECPILEHIDFDFKDISTIGSYPFNDLEISGRLPTSNNGLVIDSESINRSFYFFDEPRYRNNRESINIISKNPDDDIFTTKIIQTDHNIIYVENLPDFDLKGAKISKQYENSKSLLISQNFVTGNDYINFGKWGNILIYSPYNHPTGVDKYNHSTLKEYENKPYRTVPFPGYGGPSNQPGGETYNPYLGWGALTKFRNYDGSQLLPDNYSIHYQPTTRLIPATGITHKYLESMGIGHGSTQLTINQLPYMSGDNIISFHNKIDKTRAYFYVGGRVGRIGVAVTINNFTPRGKVLCTLGNETQELPINATAKNLDPGDPYYLKPQQSGLSVIDDDCNKTTFHPFYANGDKTTLKFIFNKTSPSPFFGYVEIQNSNDTCAAVWGGYIAPAPCYTSTDNLINFSNNINIESVFVFMDDNRLLQNDDRVLYYKHKNSDNKKSKDYSGFLDMHMYNTTVSNYIQYSGIVNFENVFTLRPGSYFDKMKTKYNSHKYLVDVQDTADWGVLTSQNWYILPDKKYTLIKNFELVNCNKDASDFFENLCDGGYNYSISELMDTLGLDIEDFIIEDIDYELTEKQLTACCVSGVLNQYPNPYPYEIDRDYCQKEAKSLFDYAKSKYSLQSGISTEDGNPCKTNSMDYKVRITGYKFYLDQNKILSKFKNSTISSYIFSTGNLAKLETTPFVFFDGRKNNLVNFDGSNFYTYGTTTINPDTNNLYYTSKVQDIYTADNCRHPKHVDNLYFPLTRDWINGFVDKEDNLSIEEQLQNEIKFRSNIPHDQRIAFPLYDYDKTIDGNGTEVTYDINVGTKKCIGDGSLFTLDIEQHSIKFAIKRICREVFLLIDDKQYTLYYLFNASLKEISYNISEPEYDYSCGPANKTGSDDGPLPDMEDPQRYEIPLPPNYQCKTCYDPCSASVEYREGDYDLACPSVDCEEWWGSTVFGYICGFQPENFPFKIGCSSYNPWWFSCGGPLPFDYRGVVVGVSPPDKTYYESLVNNYDNSCKSAGVEWSVTMPYTHQAVAGTWNNDPDPKVNHKILSAEVNNIYKVKSNIDKVDASAAEIIKNNNYIVQYCSPIKGQCITEPLDPGIDIRNCCDKLDFIINLQIVSYTNFIEIFVKYNNQIKKSICLPRYAETSFKCPRIKLTLQNSNLYINDNVRTKITNCSLGAIE